MTIIGGDVPAPPTGDTPSGSTCEQFTTVEAVVACDATFADLDSTMQDALIQAATDYMFEVTGRQFGRCLTTLPVCADCHCGCGPVGAFGWSWWPDSWRDCSCAPSPTVDLGPSPVSPNGIVSVTFEGVVLDAASYTVRRNRYLIRLDDTDGRNPGWPSARLSARDGEEGSLVVSW